jgi:hypothetical protein
MTDESTYVTTNDGTLIEWDNDSIREKVKMRQMMERMELYSTKVETYYDATTKKKKKRRKK